MKTDYAQLALAAHRENRVADAIKQYQLFLQEAPGAAEGWLAYGILLHEKVGDRANAEQCYRNALLINSGLEQAKLQLGILLAESDRSVEALPFLEQGLMANTPRGYGELAGALVRLGDMEKAEYVARRFCHTEPDHFFAWYLTGWTLARQGKYREALQCAQQAVLRDPDYPMPRGFQALLCWKLGRFDESRQVLQELAAVQGAKIALSFGEENYRAVVRCWETIRQRAKEKLGLHTHQPVRFINLYGGLGDQFFMASVLKNIRHLQPELPLVALVDKNSSWDELYHGAVDLFLKVDKEDTQQLMYASRFFPDHPYTPFYPWVGQLVSVFTLREISKCFNGVPNRLDADPPVVPPAVAEATLQQLVDLGGMPGKSVLVSALSNSNPMVSGRWWAQCVAVLRQAGFTVFQNVTNMWTADDRDLIPGATPVELSGAQVYGFCEAAGYFIGVRNGLCDLLLTAKARKKALHLRKRYPVNGRYPLAVWLDFRLGYSLNRCSEIGGWDDIDIGTEQAEFDPSILEDWL